MGSGMGEADATRSFACERRSRAHCFDKGSFRGAFRLVAKPDDPLVNARCREIGHRAFCVYRLSCKGFRQSGGAGKTL